MTTPRSRFQKPLVFLLCLVVIVTTVIIQFRRGKFRNWSKSGQTQPSNPIDNENDLSQPIRKWAYAFLLAGCDPNHEQYKGYLYNTLVTTNILQKTGTQADMVVMVQMSANTNATVLPDEDVDLLHGLDIKIQYIPKFKSTSLETFYSIQFEKFRILDMTEYSRVLFLDENVMPTGSLDYMFKLSESYYEDEDAVMKENIIMSYKQNPVSSAMFLMRPAKWEFVQIQKIIEEREKEALVLPYPHFDTRYGWGHEITPPDQWEAVDGDTGTNWEFPGAISDGGLLYFYAKYIRKSVSIIIGDKAENWGRSDDNSVIRENVMDDALRLTKSISGRYTTKPKPYSDFHLFADKVKPWMVDVSAHIEPNDPIWQWYAGLDEVSQRLGIPLDLDFTGTESGGNHIAQFTSYKARINYIKTKQQYDWNGYDT